MARRPRFVQDMPKEVATLKSLLDEFVERLESADLREQVRGLIPVVHSVRDLGSSLLPADGADAARDRIQKYLSKYAKVLVEGDELLVVSGIGEWARRTRELRVEFGWPIYTGVTIREIAAAEEQQIEALRELLGTDPLKVKPDQYILIDDKQDLEAAHRWNTINSIKRSDRSVKDKILTYLRGNVGKIVTGEELRYLASNRSEWARRARELRTEDGWPVFTRMQGRSDIPVGSYLLEEDKQAPEHDRHIKDDVRVAVMTRDGFKCVVCGWPKAGSVPGDPRKFLEIHHRRHHVDGGANTEDNLVTLCNVDHDAVHRGTLQLEQ